MSLGGFHIAVVSNGVFGRHFHSHYGFQSWGSIWGLLCVLDALVLASSFAYFVISLHILSSLWFSCVGLGLMKLKELDLSENQFTGEIPTSLEYVTSPEVFKISIFQRFTKNLTVGGSLCMCCPERGGRRNLRSAVVGWLII